MFGSGLIAWFLGFWCLLFGVVSLAMVECFYVGIDLGWVKLRFEFLCGGCGLCLGLISAFGLTFGSLFCV